VNLFLLGRETSGSLRVGFLTWLYLCFSPPVFLFVSQLYPEIPAAALVAWAIRVIRRLPVRSPATLPSLALALLGLVLLKGRYAAVAGPLLVWGLARLRRPRPILAGLVLSGLVVAGLWALDRHLGGLIYRLHYHVAGWPNPRNPVAMGTALVGLFADQEFGLLASAPVYVLALLGIPVALRRDPHAPALLGVLAIAVAPLLGPYWFAGFSSPARYLVAIVPVLAVLVAWTITLDRARWIRAVALACWWASLALSVILTVRPMLRYNRGTGETRWMSTVAARTGLDLSRFAPSFVSPSPESHWVAVGLASALAVGLVATAHASRRRDEISARPPPGLAAPIGALAILVGVGGALTLAAMLLPTTQVKAETMASEGRGARFEGSEAIPVRMWVMQAPGRLSKTIHLAPGPIVLRVVAGGYSTDDEAPHLTVRLDGQEVGAAAIATGDHAWRFGAYEMAAVVSAGAHQLQLECPNAFDDRRRGRGRYLGVDRVEITRVR
jgi:Ca-dependent carbohydrate-binding module xylan-binding